LVLDAEEHSEQEGIALDAVVAFHGVDDLLGQHELLVEWARLAEEIGGEDDLHRGILEALGRGAVPVDRQARDGGALPVDAGAAALRLARLPGNRRRVGSTAPAA